VSVGLTWRLTAHTSDNWRLYTPAAECYTNVCLMVDLSGEDEGVILIEDSDSIYSAKVPARRDSDCG
jgi:hypothetical protein